ncbi:MAG: NADH-quinone oxidoreductase subunit NuoH [Bryobacteraceae bacterium]|nr:NADH-quinone oxidoreductase subunit NuoH [Bryobacterales bacterium]MEB2363215.1 NADH-quinone oxidoreductase subunit NuoH [Bryobacterales bacterium]NUN03216.1 NADH-quinone oxidoreductase subunit NuoH [Bryobacteraceae bacterium]
METVLQHPLFIPILMTLIIIGVFPLLAGYLVLVERKVLADFQVRLGPMRVGPHGFLQPIADALKLFLKEDILPSEADRAIFWMAPVISTFTALSAFAVIPFAPSLYVADVNVGLLVISATSAVGILGIILGGWASNSHYPLLGGLRSAAQLVSYEVALSLALISGVMMAGTLSMVGIVEAQRSRGVWFAFDNFGLMLVPFTVYVISAIAETNRAPFDLPEAESELVAGFHTEYSGFRWALYFLAEYANIFVVSSVAITLFWGGWLRPFPNVGFLEVPLNYVFPALLMLGSGAGSFLLLKNLKSSTQKAVLAAIAVVLITTGLLFLIPAVNQALIGLFWFFLKVAVMVYALIWFRGTFPRFRYDQLMNIGWKYMIPIGMGAILVNAVVGIALANPKF